MSADHYILIVHLEIQEARVDEFIKLIEHDARETIKTEPGAVTFEVS